MEGKEQNVKAILGQSGNVAYITGEAPYQLFDLADDLKSAREAIRLIRQVCDIDDQFEGEWGLISLRDAVVALTKAPLEACEEGIKRLQQSFPEDEGLNKYRILRGEYEKETPQA